MFLLLTLGVLFNSLGLSFLSPRFHVRRSRMNMANEGYAPPIDLELEEMIEKLAAEKVKEKSRKPLSGTIACVTGASRGIGKGIALGLAEQGATIYVSGRSSSSGDCTDPKLGGDLDTVVKEVAALGGKGIAVKCNHNNEEEVKALFERIDSEQGRLDILVNNAFQVPQRPDGLEDKDLLFRDFWEQPGWYWDAITDVGVKSHYLSSVYGAPIMIRTARDVDSNTDNDYDKKVKKSKKPLIVMISSFGGISYSFNVAYGVGKAAVDRMATDMSRELAKHQVNCISLYPGVVRTEKMMDMLDSGEYERRTGLATPSEIVESPLLQGRVIASLYLDEDSSMSKSNGNILITAEVAKKNNVIDKNGMIPPSIRSLKWLIPSLVLHSDFGKKLSGSVKSNLINNTPDWLLPLSVMKGGPPDS